MRHGKLFALTVAVVGLCFGTPALAAEPAAPAAQDLDAYVAAQMEEAGIAGMGAAILVDRKVVWTKGYGFADVARQVPFTPDTVMNVGSISKTVTGVALMRALQEDKLSLDVDVNRYLPFKVVNPHRPGEVITLRQLATHTSSISDRWEVYSRTYHYGGEPTESLGEFLQAYFVPGGAHYAPQNYLDVKPGTHREYSNIGAGLAGYVVERVTGQSLSDYTRKKIFEPLGMRHTGWTLAEVGRERHSTLYVSQNGMTIPIQLYGLTTYPDGAVRTSVADLSRLFAALLDEGAYEGVRILDAPVAKEMLRFHHSEANKPDNVDLKEKNVGIFWQSKYNVTRMGHGGSDPGISTDMLSSLSRDVGVVVFSNTSLSGEQTKHYGNIFNAIWQRAEELKAAGPGTPAP